MRRAILATIILALVPCLAQAQSSDYSKWSGYGYLAPGGRVTSGSGSRATLHLGGGVERFFSRHAGMGADAGFLGTFEPDHRFPVDRWGVFSSNFVASYRAKSNRTGTEGFVTGGYTLISGDGTYNGVNFGGGFNWWFDKQVGLRVEVRDHLLLGPFHTVGLRIGLTVR